MSTLSSLITTLRTYLSSIQQQSGLGVVKSKFELIVYKFMSYVIACLDALNVHQEAVYNVKNFGAVGNGVADDTAAFTNAVAALANQGQSLWAYGGGVLSIPSGTYKIIGNLEIDTPMTIQGAHCLSSVLLFDADHGIRLNAGAARTIVENIRVVGERSAYAEWAPSTAYTLGQKRRKKLAAIGTTSVGLAPNTEADLGCFLICTQAGTSGLTSPQPGILEDEVLVDGSVQWTTVDGSLLTIKTPFCTVRNCGFTYGNGNGITIYGDGFVYIADGNTIQDCFIGNVDGCCVLTNGSDGQLTRTSGLELGPCARGAGIWDSGFFNSIHYGSQAVVCRFPYVNTGSIANVLWLNMYHEACDTGIWMHDQGKWDWGWPPIDAGLLDPRSSGLVFDGTYQKGPTRLIDSHTPPFRRDIGGNIHEEWSRQGDGFSTEIKWITTDSNDSGGYLSHRWAASATEDAYNITASRSVFGPAKMRFPGGFFLGKDRSSPSTRSVWITALDHAPLVTDISITRTNLYRSGDTILNEDGGASDPMGWRAQRSGGWGGGRQYNGGRIWTANTGNIAISEGIEPSTPNGKVFRLLRFEIFTGGVWVTDNRYSASLSNTEPTWPTVNGQTVNETLDSTHRIVWECYGDVGMDWSVLPTPTGTVST